MARAIIGGMTYDDLIRHYRTQVAAADAMKVHQSTVSDYRRNGIPALRQLQIEALTKGALRAGPECDKYRVPAAA